MTVEGFRVKPIPTHADRGPPPRARFLHQAPVRFLAVNAFDRAALHLVIPTVEHFPQLKKLFEISDHRIFNEVVSPPPALRGQLLELLFRLGREVHFHALRDTEKPRLKQATLERRAPARRIDLR